MSGNRYSKVQNDADIDNSPFIVKGPGIYLMNATILTDGGRSEDLKAHTLMAKRASSQKWVPFTNEAATNGEAIPWGIFISADIPYANIVAGDVEGQCILIGNAEFDESRMVFENAKTFDTILATGTIHARTVRDHLLTLGLVEAFTYATSGPEN